VRDDEIVINSELNEETLEKLLKFLKENDNYKDLTIINKLVSVQNKHQKPNLQSSRTLSNDPIHVSEIKT